MQSLLKRIYFGLLPPVVRRRVRPVIHPLLTRVEREVYARSSRIVASGPFRGMKIDRPREQRLGIPLMLGTYEMELHEVFDRLARERFTTIIDIGAAEGYYAIGTLLWKPGARVIAYEANPKYHDSLRSLAEANGVSDRLQIHGACDRSALTALSDRLAAAFLIVDVEGYEKELLDPQEIPALRQATLLVEVHNNFVPGCSEAILERFQSTHDVTVYQSRPRRMEDYPLSSRLRTAGWMRGAIEQTISDGRTAANGWLFLQPKAV